MSSKEEIIRERQSNLPLPEQPPVASDWNSADERNVNVGSGRLTENATTANAREGKDDLSGLPDDAVARDKKGATGTVETTKEGFEGKN
jgi:hypothetical protein